MVTLSVGDQNENFQEMMKRQGKERREQWDFERDPFRVRNSRPESQVNLYGQSTVKYTQTHKKSIQHRVMDRLGMLSKDPAVRQVSPSEKQRIFSGYFQGVRMQKSSKFLRSIYGQLGSTWVNMGRPSRNLKKST